MELVGCGWRGRTTPYRWRPQRDAKKKQPRVSGKVNLWGHPERKKVSQKGILGF